MDEFLRRVINGEYVLEENRKLDEIKKNYKKIKNMSNAERARFDGRNAGDVNSSTKDSMITGGAIGAFSAGVTTGAIAGLTPFIVPGLVLGAVGGAVTYTAIGKATNARVKKSIVKYSKGDPITKSTVTKLLNACKTTKDLNKFKRWLTLVDNNIKLIYKKEPEKTKMAENFRNWLDKEIYNDKLLKKESEIKKREKQLKESYEPYELNSYDFMTNEEFCDLMELEATQYKDAVSVSDIMESLNIYDIISTKDNSEYLTESISDMIKKHKDKKETKNKLKNILIIEEKDLNKYKSEVQKIFKSIQSIVKNECDLSDNELDHNKYDKGDYEFHTFMATITENFPKDKQLRSDVVNKIRTSCKLVKDDRDGSAYDSCKIEKEIKYITVFVTSSDIGLEANFAIKK